MTVRQIAGIWSLLRKIQTTNSRIVIGYQFIKPAGQSSLGQTPQIQAGKLGPPRRATKLRPPGERHQFEASMLNGHGIIEEAK